jgi:hypothetical protein
MPPGSPWPNSWVANADSRNVASHCRYTHYGLAAPLATGSAP